MNRGGHMVANEADRNVKVDQPTSLPGPAVRPAAGATADLRYRTDRARLPVSDCRYLHINQRLTEICGISIEGHLGRTVRECVPALADTVEAIVASIMATGAPVTGIEVAGQRPRSDRRPRVGYILASGPEPGWPDRGGQRRGRRDHRTQTRRSGTAGQRRQFHTLADSIPQLVLDGRGRRRIFGSTANGTTTRACRPR